MLLPLVAENGYIEIKLGDLSVYFNRRNHSFELQGPLTGLDLLQTLGEVQLYEAARNLVLFQWMNEHVREEPNKPDDAVPVTSLPIKPEWRALYEAKKVTMAGMSVNMPPANRHAVRILEPPADLDPFANKSLDDLLDFLGGKQYAIEWIHERGTTEFVGLVPGPYIIGKKRKAAPTNADKSINEWTMIWSDQER